MEEIWKPIPDLPNFYASSQGRIKRVTRRSDGTLFERILSPYIRGGYCFVTIYFGSGHAQCGCGHAACRVHRLVASAFLGESDLYIDHINRNRSDNRIENLRYVTPYENRLNCILQPKETIRLMLDGTEIYQDFHSKYDASSALGKKKKYISHLVAVYPERIYGEGYLRNDGIRIKIIRHEET